MAIIFNLKRGTLRSTNGRFAKPLDRKHKRIRFIGNGMSATTEDEKNTREKEQSRNK